MVRHRMILAWVYIGKNDEVLPPICPLKSTKIGCSRKEHWKAIERGIWLLARGLTDCLRLGTGGGHY